jgi:hypothetical protein
VNFKSRILLVEFLVLERFKLMRNWRKTKENCPRVTNMRTPQRPAPSLLTVFCEIIGCFDCPRHFQYCASVLRQFSQALVTLHTGIPLTAISPILDGNHRTYRISLNFCRSGRKLENKERGPPSGCTVSIFTEPSLETTQRFVPNAKRNSTR